MPSIFTWYFLSFNGRISRKEFWLGYLGLLAACGLLSQALLYVALQHQTGRIWQKAELSVALSMPFVIAVAVLFWPFLSISVKRLHDLDLAGWWLLLLVTIPMLSVIIGIPASTLWLVSMLLLGSLSGIAGSNRFGSEPPSVVRRSS